MLCSLARMHLARMHSRRRLFTSRNTAHEEGGSLRRPLTRNPRSKRRERPRKWRDPVALDTDRARPDAYDTTPRPAVLHDDGENARDTRAHTCVRVATRTRACIMPRPKWHTRSQNVSPGGRGRTNITRAYTHIGAHIDTHRICFASPGIARPIRSNEGRRGREREKECTKRTTNRGLVQRETNDRARDRYTSPTEVVRVITASERERERESLINITI